MERGRSSIGSGERGREVSGEEGVVRGVGALACGARGLGLVAVFLVSRG